VANYPVRLWRIQAPKVPSEFSVAGPKERYGTRHYTKKPGGRADGAEDGQPDAENAEVPQKSQKDFQRSIFFFASSANPLRLLRPVV